MKSNPLKRVFYTFIYILGMSHVAGGENLRSKGRRNVRKDCLFVTFDAVNETNTVVAGSAREF